MDEQAELRMSREQAVALKVVLGELVSPTTQTMTTRLVGSRFEVVEVPSHRRAWIDGSGGVSFEDAFVQGDA